MVNGQLESVIDIILKLGSVSGLLLGFGKFITKVRYYFSKPSVIITSFIISKTYTPRYGGITEEYNTTFFSWDVFNYSLFFNRKEITDVLVKFSLYDRWKQKMCINKDMKIIPLIPYNQKEKQSHSEDYVIPSSEYEVTLLILSNNNIINKITKNFSTYSDDWVSMMI